MSLQIFNTLTRKKEEFKPLNPPHVSMYVCGVTVYDLCHLGHARSLISFDVINRYLQYKGYQVKFVRNFTDVDDKIINKAHEEKIPWDEVSKKYIEAFHVDTKALGLRDATLEPKATEHIQEMIDIIQSLIKKDLAYRIGDDVFYAVRKNTQYGKLSGKNIDDLSAGARVDVMEAKRDPLDFALWKSSKPGEPAWDSPWGKGRPGWHIECSAMSIKYLNETFDIHGGGRDLIFPHHENEIAQSEGATGKPFARYWLHNGFVNIDAEKMSKSLGNFLTIRDVLKVYPAEAIRLFILSAQYRSPIDYTDQNLVSCRQSLERWYSTLVRLNGATKSQIAASEEKKLIAQISDLLKRFEESMDDDFNTARVVGLLFDFVKDLNRVLDGQKTVSQELSQTLFDVLQKIHDVFGVFGSDPQAYLKSESELKLAHSGVDSEKIEKLILERNNARQSKDWPTADRVRKELADLGVKIKDNPDGTTSWNL